MSLGEYIRMLRDERGLTQEALARRLPSLKYAATIWKIENDERELKFTEVVEIARLFDVPIDYFAGQVPKALPCETCGNEPPAGFECRSCGRSS